MSNGHGEDAIAAHIATEVNRLARIAMDHLALVGDLPANSAMRAVGPRRAMPSGGLIAMGNFRNIAADVGAGIISHTLRQWRFLRESRTRYDAVVAVGDVFALRMALVTGCRTLYVGTAKSVHVAPYGPLERGILKRAAGVFVRDEPTAESLRHHGINAQAAGNVIADFVSSDVSDSPRSSSHELLALLPGSRSAACGDAVFLAGVLRSVVQARPGVRGALSIAPGLRAESFAQALRADGWIVKMLAGAQTPFAALVENQPLLHAWSGDFAALLPGATLVLGQAGTANEAAAAAGIPIVAFEEAKGKKTAWYRRRQARLLGDALHVADKDLASASATVLHLLENAARRDHMSRIGRQRMGPPGGAMRIAREVVEVLQRAPA